MFQFQSTFVKCRRAIPTFGSGKRRDTKTRFAGHKSLRAAKAARKTWEISFRALSCRRQAPFNLLFRVLSYSRASTHSIRFFVSFRVRRRRLSCLTMRHARRAGRSRRRASSLLEHARRHELHGRRTPTDASVSFRARAPAHHSIPFFVPFRVRQRRLSCLTMRHARRAGRSRRRASSSLELARRHELHGRRTPTDASVSFRARASAQKLARQRPSELRFDARATNRFAAPAGVKPSGNRTRFTFETSLNFFASSFQSPQ